MVHGILLSHLPPTLPSLHTCSTVTQVSIRDTAMSQLPKCVQVTQMCHVVTNVSQWNNLFQPILPVRSADLLATITTNPVLKTRPNLTQPYQCETYVPWRHIGSTMYYLYQRRVAATLTTLVHMNKCASLTQLCQAEPLVPVYTDWYLMYYLYQRCGQTAVSIL